MRVRIGICLTGVLILSQGMAQPPHSLRMMAEWEPVEWLVVSWPQPFPALREIVSYAQEVCSVMVITPDPHTAREYLLQGKVPLSRVVFRTASVNSVWIRDYGPMTLYAGAAQTRLLADWTYNRPRPLDDRVPELISLWLGDSLLPTGPPQRLLTHAGGNLLADGLGTGFSSRLVLRENAQGMSGSRAEKLVRDIAHDYLGINRYILMRELPYDGIHHLDMHLKLLDEETLLAGMYPPGVSDGPWIAHNLAELQETYQNPLGRPYRILPIPMPTDHGRYPDQGGRYFSYVNSVIVNTLVLVPQYGLPEDSLALELYRQYMPGYHIKGINCREMISAGGALHCLTQTIGVREPCQIIHAHLDARPAGDTWIRARVHTAANLQAVVLVYAQGPEADWHRIPMTQDTVSGYWVAQLPPGQAGDSCRYYLEAITPSRTFRRPAPGPAGAWVVRWQASPYR
ncbi:MAG: agmatine deiminase family protein [Bacteroidia bacterium]|nr:agmatine deiminase family protein [Bacteroidia bacterium]